MTPGCNVRIDSIASKSFRDVDFDGRSEHYRFYIQGGKGEGKSDCDIEDVLHHIENRPAYYARLATALKPGGRIVVVDFFKKELPVGPPATTRLGVSVYLLPRLCGPTHFLAGAPFRRFQLWRAHAAVIRQRPVACV